MSVVPSQLVLTNADVQADCCCIHCPTFDDCDGCPDVMVQPPTYSWDCSGGGTLACGGNYSPPLTTISFNGACQWISTPELWCPDGLGYPRGILGGCDVPYLAVPSGIQRWGVWFEFWVSYTGGGMFSRKLSSLFVNEEALPDACMPTGVYKHLATAVGTGSEPPECEPFLTNQVGDLLVIAV